MNVLKLTLVSGSSHAMYFIFNIISRLLEFMLFCLLLLLFFFSFLFRITLIGFHNGCTDLQTHQQWQRLPFSSPLSTSVIVYWGFVAFPYIILSDLSILYIPSHNVHIIRKTSSWAFEHFPIHFLKLLILLNFLNFRHFLYQTLLRCLVGKYFLSNLLAASLGCWFFLPVKIFFLV